MINKINKIFDVYKRTFWSSERYARSIGVKIGSGCAIATKKFGSEPYLITIGNNVQITNDVKFFNHGGGWVFRKDHPDFDTFGKILIGNNVYIGNNSLIMPGVEIGDNVIIGAGSVVTKSIPSDSIYGGNPAKKIGIPGEYLEKNLKFNLGTKKLSYDEKKKFLLSRNDDSFIKK